MDHVVLKKVVYWVRMVVPPDLVKIIGKKNLIESLETKDKTVAKTKKHVVIARFQDQLVQARNVLEPRVVVPITPLVQEIVPCVITRGGFGRRFVLQRDADAILAEFRGRITNSDYQRTQPGNPRIDSAGTSGSRTSRDHDRDRRPGAI
jgi:hypothetical protein